MKPAKKISFTEGPLFWRLLLFALPVMATGLLQILYNAADKFVVGQFSGDTLALGAIGSTTFISALIINFLAGVGGGSGIVTAQFFGAKRDNETSRAVHTSVLMAVGIGLFMTVIAFLTAEPLLQLLGTKPELMSRALSYLRIIYVGIVASSLYNTVAAIFRSVGDSKTPLIIGSIAGIMNVILNFILVIFFDLSVEGVGWATTISQYFSAIASLVILARRHGESYRFSLGKLRLDKGIMLRVLRIGLPTGLQSTCFSITNMITTSAVNTFPTEYVTAHSVSGNIDGILDVISISFMHSAMNAAGQNYGAKRFDRVKKVFFYSVAQGAAITFSIAMIIRIFRADIAGLFVDMQDPARDLIIAATAEWTGVMLSTYFLQAVMNAVIGTVRGLGYSVSPLICNIIGTCVTRVVWVYLVFFNVESLRNFAGLAMLYPVSWFAAAAIFAVLVLLAFKRLGKAMPPPSPNSDGEESLTKTA